MSDALIILEGTLGIALGIALNWIIWSFVFRLIRDTIRQFRSRKSSN